MPTLSLDLSTELGSAAIAGDDGTVATAQLLVGHRSLRDGMRLVDTVRSLAEIELREVDLLAGVTGPGTWTGLRVCATTLNSMAYALDVPVVPVTLLDVFARCLGERAAESVAVIQVSSRDAFVAPLHAGATDPVAETPPLIGLADLPAAVGDSPSVLSALPATVADLVQRLPVPPVVARRSFPPIAEVAGEIARDRFRADPAAGTPIIRPFYVGRAVHGSSRRPDPVGVQ